MLGGLASQRRRISVINLSARMILINGLRKVVTDEGGNNEPIQSAFVHEFQKVEKRMCQSLAKPSQISITAL